MIVPPDRRKNGAHLIPNSPHAAAGIRIEPSPSFPYARRTIAAVASRRSARRPPPVLGISSDPERDTDNAWIAHNSRLRYDRSDRLSIGVDKRERHIRSVWP
jgi:hypothetical protein